MSDPSPEQRPPFVVNRDFIETAFEQRFQGWLRHTWQYRSGMSLQPLLEVENHEAFMIWCEIREPTKRRLVLLGSLCWQFVLRRMIRENMV